MDSARWRRLRELFDAAMDLEVSERPEFIAQSCEDDSELQDTLASLLDHALETGSSFDKAVAEAVDHHGPVGKDHHGDRPFFFPGLFGFESN